MKFDHFNITAPNNVLELCRDFYLKIFDLEVGKRPSFHKKGYWLYSGEQAVVHLTEDDNTQSHNASYLDHIAFVIEDLASFKQRLNSFEVKFVTMNPPNTAITQLFFHDPAGVQLEAIYYG